MHCAVYLLTAAFVMLGGCKLIDQRTFERTMTAPSAAQMARSAQRAAAARTQPLVTVFPGDLEHDWRPDVLAAVSDALARHPDAAFDLVTPVPTAHGAEAQRVATARGSADAATVATAIQADGVPAERLHLGARGDAGDPGREVLIFLR